MCLRPFGLFCSACLGILFVSILCMCCSHFSWSCFISFIIIIIIIIIIINNVFKLWGCSSCCTKFLGKYLWQDTCSDFCCYAIRPEVFVPENSAVHSSNRIYIFISGFRSEVGENWVLLRYCAASKHNSLPTFRGKSIGPIFEGQEPVGTEMSVTNYHCFARDNLRVRERISESTSCCRRILSKSSLETTGVEHVQDYRTRK
jgi:hypothetical protein